MNFIKQLFTKNQKHKYVKYHSYRTLPAYNDGFIIYKEIEKLFNVSRDEFNYQCLNNPGIPFDFVIPEDDPIYPEIEKYNSDPNFSFIPIIMYADEEKEVLRIKFGIYVSPNFIGSLNYDEFYDIYDNPESYSLEYIYSNIPSHSIVLEDDYITNQEYIDSYPISTISSNSKKDKLGNFVVIDVETTGLRNSSGIVELSAIKFNNFRPVEKFDTLLNPKTKIPADATAVNNITNDMVADKPHIKNVAKSFIDFVGDYNIVGHNVEFDLGLLEYRKIIFSSKRKFYDTLKIARKHLKKPKKVWDSDLCEYDIDYDYDYDVEDHKLETICDYYNVKLYNAHRSGSDCLATAIIYKKMIDEIVPYDK